MRARCATWLLCDLFCFVCFCKKRENDVGWGQDPWQSLVESFNLIVPFAVCVDVPNKSMAALFEKKKKTKSLEASQSNQHHQVWAPSR